ncbi:SAF domain-containing protein [Cellulomonas fimi]|uniref:Flagellar biosynthesis protein FlgA n=1 Tax=Cellulomonas fimi TaxID=1708 RepID=A0A7Y0QH14_CELFI|nr:SAF domain-containing protein [Cellulomonas fimi]NMR20671.1 flagellar biosynthesis protein FlgA [Cellulomonas fimi]
MPRRSWSVPDDGARRPRRRSPRLRWRLVLWRWRFLVAAALLGLAAAVVVAELRPPPPVTRPVTVAARDLPPGVPLQEQDLRVARLPAGYALAGIPEASSDVVGRSLVTAVPAGLPIVEPLLAGERLAASGPPGTVVVPVRLADPAVAALLRPGDRVDLLAGSSGSDGRPTAQRLAERALVLPGPGAGRGGAAEAADAGDGGLAGGLLGGGTVSTDGALTLVAVGPDEAEALAGVLGWADLSAVLVP